MTPAEVLAAHRTGEVTSGRNRETRERTVIVKCGCGKWLPLADHPAHVLDALAAADWAVIHPGPFVEAVGKLDEIESHCRMRVQDWGSRAAQEVVDMINGEGEWAEAGGSDA